MDHPMVSIMCLTYNQEKYVRETLDGFLMQVTDFPFEIYIHDDCSTDGTPDIIKEYQEKYPMLIRVCIEKENQYQKGSTMITEISVPYMKGKYIAYCEGDDFWIDPQKLQKQVDFLENNPDYKMCYTNFHICNETSHITQKDLMTNEPEKYPTEYTLEEWIKRAGFVAPLTWLIERDLHAGCENIGSLDETFVLFAHYLANAKVKCLKDDTTAVYRILTESASHTRSTERYYRRVKNLTHTQIRLAKMYKLPESVSQELARRYYSKAYKQISIANDREEMQISRKYCNSTAMKVWFALASFKFFRTFMKYLWQRKA